ncbi:MAG TPA: MoxR family ATPase [Chthoniobacteraceae bacterium]|jgi:MoxR-like ATPase|nr:MoxR family ATPase [Chthoniobacteraceae bacterium]
MSDPSHLEAGVQQFKTTFKRVRDEMGKMMVGQQEIVEGVLVAFFAGGHVLLEGVPGLGKTMLVRTLADAVNLKFSRVQFTPDLMPADIVGTNIISEDEHGRKAFQFQAGPIFANIVLADEINRATPKTQSALLEAMQEQHVTVGGTQHPLKPPFLVLATQNPLEMEGTYPLPEAQLDRFFFKLKVKYPTADDLHSILDRTTSGDAPTVNKVLDDPAEVVRLRDIVRQVPLAKEIQAHAIDLVLCTHPEDKHASPLAKKYVRYGASPRGAQALILAAKIYALLDDRFHVSCADIDKAAPAVLRHRIILNFEGEAEGTSTDDVVSEILTQNQ